MKVRIFALALALGCLGLAPAAQAANWRWELSDARYQALDVFQRAQYDKAADMIRQANYKGAAKEFEKFKAQFADSPVLSYVLFMRGYALYLNKDRNQAIEVFNEVLDYFGDHIDDAAAALYFTGMCHIDNGDIREGMVSMKEMADDDDYKKHPLAAGAIRRLADNHWRNKEQAEAIRYWTQVVRDFAGTSEGEVSEARSSVIAAHIKERQYAAIDEFLIDDEHREDAAHRIWVANTAYDVAWSGFAGAWDKYTEFNRDVRAADVKAFYDYYAAQHDWFVKGKADWDFLSRIIQFTAQRMGDTKETERWIDEAGKDIAKLEKKEDRDTRYSWIIDRLREARDFERAYYCVAKLSDPALALYKQYEVVGSGEGKWQEAAAKLIELTKMGDAAWQIRAEDQLAWVYKDRTGEFEKAIQLYQQMNRPPGTLWGIQECYKRMGKLKESMTTLAEIENSFPDDASRAAWYRAAYLKESGNREGAIAAARHVLKAYPRSPQASDAHQMLEGFGVQTGGGVTEEEQ